MNSEIWQKYVEAVIPVIFDSKKMFSRCLNDLSCAFSNRATNDFSTISEDLIKEKSNIIKSLKNKELRIFSYHNNVKNYIDVDVFKMPNNLPNCMPFKTMLVVPDTPTMFNYNEETTGAIVVALPYLFIYEVTPDKYILFSNLICIRRTNGSKPDAFNGLGSVTLQLSNTNIVSSPAMLSSDLIFKENTIFTNMFSRLSVMLFHEFNKVLYEAKYDSFYSLNVKNSGKMTFTNYAKRKIGQTVYSNEVLYIGKKSKIPRGYFNNTGITHKQNVAYEVMGHWRKLIDESWIGHDRDGNKIKNFTWVKPHVRGSGELKVKSRVIK